MTDSTAPARPVTRAQRIGSHIPVDRSLAGAIPKEVLAVLRRPNILRWSLALVVDWATIIAAIAVAGWLDRWWAYALGVFVIGSRQHAIAVLGHDGAHRMVARNRTLNDWLPQVCCFWPLVIDMNSYREFHFPHHRHLNTARDPEMSYRGLGAPGWDVPRNRWQIALRFVADLLGLGAFEVFRILRFTLPKTLASITAVVAMAAAFVGLCALTGNLWIAAMWYGAFLTSFSAVWRFRCWIEHLGTEDTHRVHLTWWQAWLVAPHKIWVHWEHHHWPGVPYWNLLEIRRRVDVEPVISLGDLFRYYERCVALASGTPTKDDHGRLAVKL